MQNYWYLLLQRLPEKLGEANKIKNAELHASDGQ